MNLETKSHSNQQIFDVVTKIMLADNVDVVITNDDSLTTTGCADQENKVLYVAKLIAEQDYIMPGLIIHEIAHFKYTPADAHVDTVLNIVEDGYIERKVCIEYVGAKKFLRVLFDDLIEKKYTPDGAKHTQILNTLIYNSKGLKYGRAKQYPSFLTKKELEVMKRAELIDGPFKAREDVSEEVRKIIKKYMAEEKEKEKKSEPSEADNNTTIDDGESTPENHEDVPSPITFDDDIEQIEKDDAALNEELEALDDIIDYGTQMVVDKDDSSRITIPTHQWIMRNVDVVDMDDYDPAIKIPKNVYLKTFLSAKQNAHTIYGKFMSMVAAKNYATEKYMQSGKIDPTRLPYYKITDDIFQSVQVVENQPNHFFVIALDWSQSMKDKVKTLFPKVLELVEFCKLADVKFEVVLFTSNLKPNLMGKQFSNGISLHYPSIIRVVDPSDSVYVIDRKMKQLFYLCNDVASNRLQDPLYEQTGTPILEALIYSHGVLSRRVEEKKNIIILTDGEDSNGFTIIGDGVQATQKTFVTDGASCYGSHVVAVEGFSLRENCVKIVNELFEKSHNHTTISIELIDKDGRAHNSHMFKNTISFCLEEKTNIFISKLTQLII
jgi:hypothetical protein